MDDGYFEDFDCIAIDSATTLLDCIMDRLLFINGRPGEFPGQDDYPPQMNTFGNLVRTMTSLGLDIYMTGHCELKEDSLKRITNQPLMTGRLKIKMPLLFSEIWHSEAKSKGEIVKYTIQTVPDNRNPIVRSSFRGLNPFEDMTIDWSKPLQKQGLSRILRHESDLSEFNKKQTIKTA